MRRRQRGAGSGARRRQRGQKGARRRQRGAGSGAARRRVFHQDVADCIRQHVTPLNTHGNQIHARLVGIIACMIFALVVIPRVGVVPKTGQVETVKALYDWQAYLEPLQLTVSGLTIQAQGEAVNHSFRFILRQDMGNYMVHGKPYEWEVQTVRRLGCNRILFRDGREGRGGREDRM